MTEMRHESLETLQGESLETRWGATLETLRQKLGLPDVVQPPLSDISCSPRMDNVPATMSDDGQETAEVKNKFKQHAKNNEPGVDEAALAKSDRLLCEAVRGLVGYWSSVGLTSIKVEEVAKALANAPEGPEAGPARTRSLENPHQSSIHENTNIPAKL